MCCAPSQRAVVRFLVPAVAIRQQKTLHVGGHCTSVLHVQIQRAAPNALIFHWFRRSYSTTACLSIILINIKQKREDGENVMKVIYIHQSAF